MNHHQKKTISEAKAIYAFLNEKGIQISGEGSSPEQTKRARLQQVAYHNTKLLLKNYRNILWQVDCEIDTIAAELNLPLAKLDALLSRVDAAIGMENKRIERQLDRLSNTRQLIDRINEALTALQMKPGNGKLLYQLIYLTYIDQDEHRQIDVLEELNISKRHFYRLKEEAINIISLRLWNVPSEKLDLWLELISLLNQEAG